MWFVSRPATRPQYARIQKSMHTQKKNVDAYGWIQAHLLYVADEPVLLSQHTALVMISSKSSNNNRRE